MPSHPCRFNEAPAFLRGKLSERFHAHPWLLSFNEAPAFLRGKPESEDEGLVDIVVASMRPPHFCGGNTAICLADCRYAAGFNEAPAFLRGKHGKVVAASKTPVALQ